MSSWVKFEVERRILYRRAAERRVRWKIENWRFGNRKPETGSRKRLSANYANFYFVLRLSLNLRSRQLFNSTTLLLDGSVRVVKLRSGEVVKKGKGIEKQKPESLPCVILFFYSIRAETRNKQNHNGYRELKILKGPQKSPFGKSRKRLSANCANYANFFYLTLYKYCNSRKLNLWK